MAAAVMQQQSDRAALAQRIQGFGNVNPPPLEDETAGNVAKRAVRNLGGIVGEEVALTVQDFKEKGAVGAVKDAVADAGDILIDGVSGIVGWLRGEAPQEEETQASEDAQKVLANGPRGAAYGISQASPSGGINAVWVMPEEADPATMAELARSSKAAPQNLNPPYAPSNIQPYQPAPGSKAAAQAPQMPPAMPQYLPNGIQIAPYQPNAPGARGPPGAFPGLAMPYADPRGAPMQPPFVPGGQFPGAGGALGGYGGAASSTSGPKGFLERIAKGDVLPGPEAADRLASQCASAKVSGSQLSEMLCDRVRRLYLGLGGGASADEGLLRLLQLADAMKTQGSPMMIEAVKQVKDGVSEEFLSLKSNVKCQAVATPLLVRLGLGGPADLPDLLGEAPSSAGGAAAGAGVDLLGVDAPPAAKTENLLDF